MGENTELVKSQLDNKIKDTRFNEITRPKYSNPPTRLIRNNYNKILDTLMDNLTNAINNISPNRNLPPPFNNVPAVVTALQALNGAINLWLEFNDYDAVTCFCNPAPIEQRIFIRPVRLPTGESLSLQLNKQPPLGGKRRKMRKSKHRKTKRNSRTTKKKRGYRKKKSLGHYRK